MNRRLWIGIGITCALAIGCTADKASDLGDTGNVDGDDDDGGNSTGLFQPDPDSASISNSGNATNPDPSATGDDGGDDDTGGFITPSDAGTITGGCSPSAQDCPRGEKCTSYVSTPGERTVDDTKCVPIIGDGQAGDMCERMEDNDTCAAGFFCMTDVSGHTGSGFCLEYCDPEVGICEFGGDCFGFNGGALPVCEVTCDPLLQDCPSGQGCYFALDNFLCAMPGFPDGQGNDGDPCLVVQGCQPGLFCRPGTTLANCPTTSCCTPSCAISEGGVQCTDAGEQCVQALSNPSPSLADVGYCAIPQ